MLLLYPSGNTRPCAMNSTEVSRMKVLRLVRAIVVVVVPSLALELFAAASTVSTVRALLSRARP
jgi:hypothetical protein